MRQWSMALWLLLAPMGANAQTQFCDSLRNVLAHVETDFRELIGSPYGPEGKSHRAKVSLAGADRCWIRRDGQGIWNYWCSWRPADATALPADMRRYVDAAVQCYPQATVERDGEGTAWMHIPGGARLYWNVDESDKTVDVSIDKPR